MLAAYWPTLCSMARTMASRMGRSVRAEDLAAAIAPTMLRRLAGYDASRAAPGTYMYLLAYSCLRTERKRVNIRRARGVLSLDAAYGGGQGGDDRREPNSLGQTLASPDGDPLAAAILAEELRGLAKLLRLAGPRRRLALQMRYLEGRQYGEIGDLYGCSRQRAKQLCAEGLARIRTALATRRHRQINRCLKGPAA